MQTIDIVDLRDKMIVLSRGKHPYRITKTGYCKFVGKRLCECPAAYPEFGIVSGLDSTFTVLTKKEVEGYQCPT